ncbi:hypothetical protein LTR66_007439 [Elasticomyces elasticus]|nr:hypothetical protein LTR66_007439 [Elasticomyces elasticus]
MMMLWAWAGVQLGVYNIVKDFNIALQIQPQILAFLSLVTWTQCYYYEQNWSIPRSVSTVVPIAIIMAGVEFALVFALRVGVSRGTIWPETLMAVLAALFLALGVLRHYWDIYVHRTVRGISFIFVGIDAMGDLTSLISVFFQPILDVLGMAIYGTELILWIGVICCGAYYNLSPWIRDRVKTRPRSSLERGVSEDTPTIIEQENSRHRVITLEELPSSTSVFRTPSGELTATRTRHRTDQCLEEDSRSHFPDALDLQTPR